MMIIIIIIIIIITDVGGWGAASALDAQPLFFIKENWIWAMTRHHANSTLLARNLPFGIKAIL